MIFKYFFSIISSIEMFVSFHSVKFVSLVIQNYLHSVSVNKSLSVSSISHFAAGNFICRSHSNCTLGGAWGRCRFGCLQQTLDLLLDLSGLFLHSVHPLLLEDEPLLPLGGLFQHGGHLDLQRDPGLTLSSEALVEQQDC